MSVILWLTNLIETGRVTVGQPDAAPGADEEDSLVGLLQAIDRRCRLDAPVLAPELSIPAAAWAARTLHHACQFFVYREIDGDIVHEALAEPCPLRPSPRSCWSVDLVFRYLPDLLALARGMAEGDPLVDALARLASEWPLSSVGLRNPGELDVGPFIEDECLRRVYADRIIEKSDTSRLSDPRAAEAVREALGGFPELAPAICKALESTLDSADIA